MRYHDCTPGLREHGNKESVNAWDHSSYFAGIATYAAAAELLPVNKSGGDCFPCRPAAGIVPFVLMILQKALACSDLYEKGKVRMTAGTRSRPETAGDLRNFDAITCTEAELP